LEFEKMLSLFSSFKVCCHFVWLFRENFG
jgi:hypothetical protein